MADVILTRGGLVSQAPEAGKQAFISKITGGKVSSIVGGYSSAKQRIRDENEAKFQEALRIQAEKEAAELLRIEKEKQIAEAKSFEEKTRLAREFIEIKKGEAEQKRIEKFKGEIVSEGGQVRTTRLKESDTGRMQEITTITKRGGDRVFEVRDIETGKITSRTYEKGRQTGGVVIQPEVKEEKITEVKGDIAIGSSNYLKESTQFLKDKGVPSFIAESGEGIARFGIGTFEKGKSLLGYIDRKLTDIKESKTVGKLREKFQSTDLYSSIKNFKFPEARERPAPKEGSIEYYASKIVSPQTPVVLSEAAAEQVLKGGDILTSATIKSGALSKDSVLLTPLPIERSTARKIIGETFLFAGFSPFMKTTQAVEAAVEANRFKEFEKIISKPERSIIAVEEEIISKQASESILSKQAKLRATDESIFLKYEPTTKGRVSITVPKSTGKFIGTVEETRKVGALGKPKTFTGKVEISDGVFKETIEFPKGIKRVTTVTGGKGEVEIFKEGKLRATFDFKDATVPKLDLKTLTSKREFEKELGEAGIQKTTRVTGIDALKLKTTSKDLRTGLFQTKTTGITKYGANLKTGVSTRIESLQEVSDIIRAGPRKEISFARADGSSILKTKEVTQKIVQGDGKDLVKLDESVFKKLGEKESLFKKTEPKIQRAIIQKEKRRIVTKFEKVPTTDFQPTKTIQPFKEKEPMVKSLSDSINIPKISEGGLISKTIAKTEEIIRVKPISSFLKTTKTETPNIPILRKIIEPVKSKTSSVSSLVAVKMPSIISSDSSIKSKKQVESTDIKSKYIVKSLPLSKVDTSKLSKSISRTSQQQQQQTRKETMFDKGRKKQDIKETRFRTPSPKFEFREPVTDIVPIVKFPKTQQRLQKPTKQFSVQIRRGGEFKTVGITRDYSRAFAIGKEKVASTLAATFKIVGNGYKIRTPKGFRKKVTKEGVLFIEKRGKRLSRKGETKEITIAKKKKRVSKK